MTKRNWRILMATLAGLCLAVLALQWGALSTNGMIALVLVSIAFVGNLLALVKGW